MNMQKLIIGDKEIPYTVKTGTSKRYVYFHFKPNLELEIVMPRSSKLRAEDIIQKKKALIERKYNELTNRKKVYTDSQLMYRGKYYNVKVLPAQDGKDKVRIQGNDILVLTSNNEKMPKIRQWMKRQTEQYLKRNLTRHAEKFGINISKFYVWDTKRWGYCNTKGQLVFNWQLIALPKELIEYVINHEITHLLEFNHSTNFHKRLASLCPDFRERENMLKNVIPI
jgi:hypothetical protein